MVWISFVLTHLRGIEARRDHINAFILPIVEFHSVDMLSHNLSHFSCHYKLQIIGKHFTRTVIGCSYFLIHVLTLFLWSVSCPSSFSLAYLVWVSGIS